MIDIFDSRGMLRHDLDQIAETVPADRRPQFDALVEAIRAGEAAEAKLKAADAAITEASRRHQDAIANTPRRTFMDEWKAMVAHGRR